MKQLRTSLALFLAVFLVIQPAAGSASLLLLSASAEEGEEEKDSPVPKIDRADESASREDGGGNDLPDPGSGGGNEDGGNPGGSDGHPGSGENNPGGDGTSGSSGEDPGSEGSSSGDESDSSEKEGSSGSSEEDGSGAEDDSKGEAGEDGSENDDETNRNPGGSDPRGENEQLKNVLRDIKNSDEALGSLSNILDGDAKGKNLTAIALALAGSADKDNDGYTKTINTMQDSLSARQYQKLVNEFGINQKMDQNNYLTRQIGILKNKELRDTLSTKINTFESESRAGRVHAGIFNGILNKPINMAKNGIQTATNGALNSLNRHMEAFGMMVDNVSERLQTMTDAKAAQAERSLKYADMKKEAAKGNTWKHMKTVAAEWTNKGMAQVLPAASRGFSQMSQFGETIANSNTGKAVGDILKSGRQAAGKAWSSTTNVINKAMDSKIGKSVRNIASSPVGKLAGGALSGLSIYEGYNKVTSGGGMLDTIGGSADIASGGLGLAAVAATTVFAGTAAAAAAPALATGAAIAGVVSLGVTYGPKLVNTWNNSKVGKSVNKFAKNTWNTAKDAIGNAASAAKDAAKNVGETITSGISSIFGGSS
ncbi:hypothetical protein [Salibacterium aidingense]|uniref:hypothetical protein n=1 Tax=Salibacterium aidingense TaxID=384933 RepID=UPI003BE2BD1E